MFGHLSTSGRRQSCLSIAEAARGATATSTAALLMEPARGSIVSILISIEEVMTELTKDLKFLKLRIFDNQFSSWRIIACGLHISITSSI